MANKWSGLGDFDAAMDHVTKQADIASKTIISKSAALVVSKTMSNFEGAHAKNEPHVGGSKPNIVTGYLRRSTKMTPIVRLGLGSYETSVGPNAIYGRRVELGYKGSQGYPFFGPAVTDAQAEFNNIAQDTWAQFLH